MQFHCTLNVLACMALDDLLLMIAFSAVSISKLTNLFIDTCSYRFVKFKIIWLFALRNVLRSIFT